MINMGLYLHIVKSLACGQNVSISKVTCLDNKLRSGSAIEPGLASRCYWFDHHNHKHICVFIHLSTKAGVCLSPTVFFFVPYVSCLSLLCCLVCSL